MLFKIVIFEDMLRVIKDILTRGETRSQNNLAWDNQHRHDQVPSTSKIPHQHPSIFLENTQNVLNISRLFPVGFCVLSIEAFRPIGVALVF